MLPFEPELEESLKARYPEAVRDVVDIGKTESCPQVRPGLSREHVFDLFDGLRLIISKDKLEVATVLHVSASMYPTNTFNRVDEFLDFVMEHFIALRGEPVMGPVSFFVTTQGILHVSIPEKNFNPKWN
jgi:hypothetical protein